MSLCLLHHHQWSETVRESKSGELPWLQRIPGRPLPAPLPRPPLAILSNEAHTESGGTKEEALRAYSPRAFVFSGGTWTPSSWPCSRHKTHPPHRHSLLVRGHDRITVGMGKENRDVHSLTRLKSAFIVRCSRCMLVGGTSADKHRPQPRGDGASRRASSAHPSLLRRHRMSRGRDGLELP